MQEIEHQVEAAVAEAISAQDPSFACGYEEDDGVMVEPYIPQATTQQNFEEQHHVAETPVPSVYVPSHAERPDGQRRMPRTEELPAVARRSLEATERHEPEQSPARALFKRLASNVGLNKRSEPDEPARAAADDAAARSAIEAGPARGSRSSAPVDGAHGQSDSYGRAPAPQPAKDHLEIPAFLRKHG
jgi:cell division protein FtsZ